MFVSNESVRRQLLVIAINYDDLAKMVEAINRARAAP